jgi:hypothetical protein
MSETQETKAVFQKSADQTSATVGDDEVVLQMVDGVYYSLNSTGKEVWKMLEEPASIDSLVDGLMEKFEVDRQSCQESVQELLEQMEAAHLVVRLDSE